MLLIACFLCPLQASLSYVPEDNQAKIMGLLGQFNNVLQYKQGTKRSMKMNRHVVGMYEWVIQDVARAVSALCAEQLRAPILCLCVLRTGMQIHMVAVGLCLACDHTLSLQFFALCVGSDGLHKENVSLVFLLRAQYREELEESQRWAVTPPEPPEGLNEELMDMYEDIMSSLVS